MAEQWYYAQQGQRQGPVTEEQLKQLASSGQLKPTDKVWKKGMAAWQAASAVEGLIPKPAEDEPPPIPLESDPSTWTDFQELVKPAPSSRDFLGNMLQWGIAKFRLIARAVQSAVAKLRSHVLSSRNARDELVAKFRSTFNIPVPTPHKAESYREAAEQGGADAQNNLGDCLKNGLGAPQDYAEAMKWYRKAAEQGHGLAQCNLAACYRNGQGTTQDNAEARKWYQKAADQGVANAQFYLGSCYFDGEGFPQDYTEALKWFLKAAENGSKSAENSVGCCYENGYGAPQDIVQALHWYDRARRTKSGTRCSDEPYNTADHNYLRLIAQHPELDPLKKLGKGLLAGAAVVGSAALAAAAGAAAVAAASRGGAGSGSNSADGKRMASMFYGGSGVCKRCGEQGVAPGTACRACGAPNV